MKRLFIALALLAFSVPALGQSSPNLITGQVPTAAQWNSYFANKQDYAGYVPLSKGGGVLSGVLRSSMGAPTISGCGTGPSVNGNNQAAEVTMGTGSPTGCTITFATETGYSAPPICVVTWKVNLASMQYTVSQTAIVLIQTATSSNKVNYICWGLQ